MNLNFNLGPTSMVKNVNPHNVLTLENLFFQDGLVVPVHSKTVKSIPLNDLIYFCNRKAIYGIITWGLIEYLGTQLDLTKAIEIGCGNGTLGRDLGIPLTDSMHQARPEVKQYYDAIGHPTIKYPTDVVQLDALEAVEKYEPETVIGSWITHKYHPAQHHLGGNVDGVDGIALMRSGIKRYIMLGNKTVHKDNPLFKYKGVKVKEFKLPFLMSRSKSVGQNRLYLFTKK